MADPTATSPTATRRLIRTADGLTDEQYAEPRGLPGWTRAHVLAHLALNAEGLAGALGGRRRGPAGADVRLAGGARRRHRGSSAAQAPRRSATRLLGGVHGPGRRDRRRTPRRGRRRPIDRVPGRARRSRPPTCRGCGCARWRSTTPTWTPATTGPAVAAGVRDRTCSTAVRRAAAPTAPFTARATDLDRAWTFGEGGPVVTGRGRRPGLVADRPRRRRGTDERAAATLPQIGAMVNVSATYTGEVTPGGDAGRARARAPDHHQGRGRPADVEQLLPAHAAGTPASRCSSTRPTQRRRAAAARSATPGSPRSSPPTSTGTTTARSPTSSRRPAPRSSPAHRTPTRSPSRPAYPSTGRWSRATRSPSATARSR